MIPRAFGHCLDGGVRSRQKLVSDREGFGNHGREVCIEFSLASIFNEKALPFAGTSQLRLDRQDDRRSRSGSKEAIAGYPWDARMGRNN